MIIVAECHANAGISLTSNVEKTTQDIKCVLLRLKHKKVVQTSYAHYHYFHFHDIHNVQITGIYSSLSGQGAASDKRRSINGCHRREPQRMS
jgi:hypothetical protein